MFENIGIFAINFFVSVISWISSLVIKPIFDLFVNMGLFPQNYLTTLNNFINTFFDYVNFSIHVIHNVTGLPYAVINFFGAFLFFSFWFYGQTLMVRFVLNAWGLFRAGKSVSKAVD